MVGGGSWVDNGSVASGDALTGDDCSSSSEALEDIVVAFAGADLRRGAAAAGLFLGRGGLKAVALRFFADFEASGIFSI